MIAKRLSPIAINALKDALCSIYWYKNDLRSFLQNCVVCKSLILNANWGNYKRQIVLDIVDEMCSDQDKYLGDIRRVLIETVKMTNFVHLEQLEDGKKKAQQAKLAVRNLAEIVNIHDHKLREEEEATKRRKEMFEKQQASRAIKEKLDTIKNEYSKLVCSKEVQQRGFALEKVLYDLFNLFDLDPKASFRNTGEQIDGAFTLEGTDYLFESKWHNQPVGIFDLDAFSGKVKRKLDNTLGLFLSINGYSSEAVQIHSCGRSSILLMDGMELLSVLEGRIDFVSLIIRKRRHAAQTGEIYLRIYE